MNITLILFWIGILGFLLHRKNIISQTSKFLLLVSYKNVDLIGPTFKSIKEGFLIVTLPLSRFMVSGFFGREVGVSRALCSIFSLPFPSNLYVVIAQSILYVVTFYFGKVIIFNNRDETLKFSSFINRRIGVGVGVHTTTKRHIVNYILRNKVYFSTSSLNSGDSDNLKGASSLVNKNNCSISPWFVTGFVDGEGTFTISVTRDSKYKFGWRVRLFFQINLHIKDINLLKQIKNYFTVGKINVHEDVVSYVVFSEKGLVTIAEHFHKYTLCTQKSLDFKFWFEVLNLIQKKEHTTMEGLKKIVALKASTNKGLTQELITAFPSIIPVERPLNLIHVIPDPIWLAGFISGEGCFFVGVRKSKASSLGMTVQCKFQITQHLKEKHLMVVIQNLLQCGKLYNRKGAMDITVVKFDDLVNKILPFLVKYPILGVKTQDFEDWRRVINLMENKAHLNQEGLERIKHIKDGMNKKRILFVR